jgi:hypothetical protein
MRSTAAIWLLLLASTLLCGGLLEGFSYLLVTRLDNQLGNGSQRHVYSPLRGHEVNPGYRRGFDTAGVKIHSDQGFRRDGAVARAKPAGTFRIFALGGSALYGIGASDDGVYPRHRALLNDETITFFLERSLNEELERRGIDREVEVINAGVVAYHTFQHVLYVYETLFEYEPDMLIFLDGHNDFYNLTVENPIREYGYSAFAMVPALNERKPWLTLHIGARLLGQYSYFFKAVEQASLQQFERFEGRPDNIRTDYAGVQDDIEAAVERSARLGFLRNYRLIQTLAAEHDFSLHVFLQPEVVFEDESLLGAHDRAIKRATETWYGPARVGAMREARSHFPRLFAKAEIPFTDLGELASAATRAEKLYIDYCHLMAEGSAVAAARMLPALAERIEQQLGLGPGTLSSDLATGNAAPDLAASGAE